MTSLLQTDELAAIAAQSAGSGATRGVSFFLAGVGSFLWFRGRRRLATFAFFAGALVSLSSWLLQITSPLGLSVDPSLTRQWAQAGVNANAGEMGSGFVLGQEPERSIVSSLAATGVPLIAVQQAPQLGCVLLLSLLYLAPFKFVRGASSAAFATIIAVAGGLWPGFEPFGRALRSPAYALWFGCGIVVVLAFGRARARLHWNKRKPVVLCLLMFGVLSLAAAGDFGSQMAPAAFLATSLIAVARLRSIVRARSTSSLVTARREALLLFCVSCGSGLFWWNPRSTVRGFAEATDRADAIRAPMEWILANVPRGEVVLAGPEYSAPIAALGGHRVLFPPPDVNAGAVPEPFKRARLLESAKRGKPVTRLAQDFSVTYFLIGPGEPTPNASTSLTNADEGPAMKIEAAYQDAHDFRIFRFLKK